MTIGAIQLNSVDGQKPSAPTFVVDVEFVGDDSYPTGGTTEFTEAIRDAVEAARAALSDSNVRGRSNFEIICVAAADAGQYVPWYDKDNDTLFVRDGGAATWTEVANTTNLSATTFKLTLLCR